MRCNELEKFKVAFIDGELDVERNLGILEHLNICPDCSKKYDDEKEFGSLIKKIVTKEQAPLYLKEKIKDSISDRYTQPGFFNRIYWLPKIRLSLIGGIAILLIAFSILFSNKSNTADKFAYAAELHYHHYLEGEIVVNNIQNNKSNKSAEFIENYYYNKSAIPNLLGNDFKLTKASDCSILNRPATFLVYENSDNDISLFVTKNENKNMMEGIKGLTKQLLGKHDFYFGLGKCGFCNIVVWKTEQNTYTILTRLSEEKIFETLSASDV